MTTYSGVFRAFTLDGQRLLTYSYSDGISRLYDLAGNEQASYEGQFTGFTPDGQIILIESRYGTTSLWNLEGDLLAEFPGRLWTISNNSLDMSRISDDERYLITSLDDTTHRIWELDNGLDDLIARACSRLQSYFNANPGLQAERGVCLD